MVSDRTLFGRRDELARLDAALRDARAGTPSVLLITGPAGIGKTSLLRARLLDAEAHVLLAVADEDEADLEYGVLGQLLRGHAPDGAPEPGDDAFRAGAVLLAAIDRLQADAPVVVVVDDAQWADERSLQALAFAARRLRADRVLVVAACRSEQVDHVPAALRRAVEAGGGTLELGPLAVAEVAELAEAVHRRPLTTAAARRLAEHAGGNPLHVRALLAELAPDALEATGRLPVPSTYAALVLERLQACPPAAEALVAALAVLGSAAPLADVAEIAGVDDPLPAVEALAAGALAELDDAATGPRLRFAHDLVHAAVEQSLTASRTAQLHRRAAAVVAGDGALRHRLAATVGPDAELVALARSAAQAEASPDRAAGYLLAAAPLAADEAETRQLVLTAATRLVLAGEPVDHLAAEIERFPPDPARDHVLGRVALGRGRLAEAEELLTRAWGGLADSGEPDTLVGPVADMLAIFAEHRGRFDEVAAWARTALDAGSQSLSSAMMLSFGRAVVDGPAAAADELARVLAGARSANVALDARLGLGIAQLYANRLEEAERTLVAVLASPRVRGSMLAFVNARMHLADRHFRAGRWADALDLAETTASIVADSGQEWLALLPHGIAAVVLAGQGQEARAREHAAATASLAEAVRLVPAQLLAAYAQLRIADAAADHERVVAVADRLGPGGQLHFPEWVHHYRATYAEALVATGRLDDAAAAAGALEREAAAGGDVSIAADAGRARGVVAAAMGDAASAQAAFAAALALDADACRPFERARLELAAGAHARRTRRRREASALLACALERLSALGAQPWIGRCERELEACGLRPAKRTRPRDDALTPQERTVARLVVTGLTNREVAAELVLSAKTIEFHLGRIYRKLGVRSRTELAARLRDAE